MFHSFIIFLFLILSTFLIYTYIKRKKYTRERFAFYATGLLFTFAILTLSHVVYDNSLIILTYKLLNFLFDTNLNIPSTDWTGKILSVLIYLSFSILIFAIFKSWDGAKSKKDYELSQKYFKANIFQFALFGSPFNKISIYETKEKSKTIDQENIEYLDEVKDWHTECVEILRLISKQYKVSESDRHEEESLYISKYANQDIAIFYTLEEPSDTVLSHKLNYLKTHLKNNTLHKLIVMVKKHHNQKHIKNIDSILIEFRYFNELLDSLVDFSEYFDFIKDEYLNNEITYGDKTKLQDIYVSPKGNIFLDTDFNSGKIIENLETYIIEWTNNDKSNKHISLLGEYGQGKSVLSLKIAYEMIMEENSRIPIIIELRGKSPKNNTFLEIIASWSSKFDISAKAIEKLLLEGRLLIILEGFDEMDMVGDSFTRSQHFKRLLEFMMYKKSKVLITGRPNLFLDTNEMKRFLNFNENRNQLFYSEAIHLSPLNTNQIEDALRNCQSKTKNEILTLVKNKKENENFIDLISRPSTLYQASIIWENLDKKNINSATVINEFIKHAYRRQDTKFTSIGKTGIKPILNVDEREYFMIGIAIGMLFNNKYSNQITKNDLKILIEKLYYNIDNEISGLEIPLTKRLKDSNTQIESLFNDVRTAGIIVKDFSKVDSFKFAHKSFLEFLIALFYKNMIINDDVFYEKIINSISKAYNINQNSFFYISEETITFVATLLNKVDLNDERECRKLLISIVGDKSLYKILQFSETLFLMHNKRTKFERILFMPLKPLSLIIQSYLLLIIIRLMRQKVYIWEKICGNVPADIKNKILDENYIKSFKEDRNTPFQVLSKWF